MIFLFIIETCFILSFPVQRTETDILHLLCSVFHARLIRNYVNHTMWKETRIATYILYFLLIKLKIFISTPQNAQKRFQTRGPKLEKRNQNFLLWESYQCPDPIQPGTTRATSTTTPRQRVWRRRSGLHSFVNKTGNRIIHAELCLAAQVRTASVHE